MTTNDEPWQLIKDQASPVFVAWAEILLVSSRAVQFLFTSGYRGGYG